MFDKMFWKSSCDEGSEGERAKGEGSRAERLELEL
jgi:hypothetical protein